MNRRSFLTILAAPLIVRPSLEDIERLTWRRRFFPGWTPSRPLVTVFEVNIEHQMAIIDTANQMMRELALGWAEALDRQILFAAAVSREYEAGLSKAGVKQQPLHKPKAGFGLRKL